MRLRRGIWLLAGLLLWGVPTVAVAQVFLASRPHPEFAIGPLFVRATITRALGPVTVDVLWSVVVPPGRGRSALDQDVYLLWPGAVTANAGGGPPDTALARYVETRGFDVVAQGRLLLSAQSPSQIGRDAPPEPVAGGAPFVTFVQTGGVLGLTRPATWIRIPWTPRLADRGWLMDLRLTTEGLVKPKEATWVERVFRGDRYLFSLSFNDVRARAVFPMYFEHRDRVIRLADAPSELIANFADADHLTIDEVFPPTSGKRRSESLESTEVVSVFLEKSEGLTPQQLTVQFGYFSGVQALTPVLIPLVFFVLGNVAARLAGPIALWAARAVAARVQLARGSRTPRPSGVILARETLARIVPGETTSEDVVRLCGPDAEYDEDLGAPDRRTLTYRGRRVVPQRRWSFGWLVAVSHWEIEHHEVRIELDRDRVRGVQARVRRARMPAPQPPP
jgi:hypothetical protein